ncbi:uncharacterized protein LOC108624214 [Ceratina calcarata]|uniref:Uncharacterized protein LOC108624214 n=1 Tax=Ceratina calcarata TaxID=156304 RepID=A0AAJ7WA52_9HYME|nr:uncharacterized protein LOC108624214 [Ceratina calcarata]
MIKLLITKGISVDVTNEFGWTPLQCAVMNNHLEGVQLLLSYGANVDAKDNDGHTAIHHSIMEGNQNIAKLLLQHKTNISLGKNDKNTLQLAIDDQYSIAIDKTLQTVYFCFKNKKNGLRDAVCGRGRKCEFIVKSFLTYGIVLSPEDVNDSELVCASVEKGHIKIVKKLLELGADVNQLHENAIFNKSTTLLHMAVITKQREMVELLINYKANVNALDERNFTAMHEAALNDDLEIMELLMDNGARIKDQYKLLCIAAETASKKFVELLLQHDINVNGKNTDGTTAIHSCVLRHPINYEILKLLIDKGADINARNNYRRTALHEAVRAKNVKVVKLLLNCNADVNSEDVDGTTPLFDSTVRGAVEICELLVKKGAKLNIKRYKRPTPLHVAASINNLDIMKILLRSGADVDCVDECGNTALHRASIRSHYDIVAILLRYGSDINIVNQENRTALYYTLEESLHILVQHVIILRVAKLYVHASNIAESETAINDKLRFINWTKYEEECNKELERMRREKINNSNISFYDILKVSINEFARNKDVVKYLKLNNCETDFPLYGSMINNRFRWGVERIKWMDESVRVCQNLFNYCLVDRMLPYICIEKIFSYLSNDDLRILVDVCKNVKNPNEM